MTIFIKPVGGLSNTNPKETLDITIKYLLMRKLYIGDENFSPMLYSNPSKGNQNGQNWIPFARGRLNYPFHQQLLCHGT
jgi:hypothetical protein